MIGLTNFQYSAEDLNQINDFLHQDDKKSRVQTPNLQTDCDKKLKFNTSGDEHDDNNSKENIDLVGALLQKDKKRRKKSYDLNDEDKEWDSNEEDSPVPEK